MDHRIGAGPAPLCIVLQGLNHLSFSGCISKKIIEDEFAMLNGYLILAGAKDDVMWNTCRGISRMKKKIEESEGNCELEILIYDHCSHFIFPESMMKLLLPCFLVDLILSLIYRETKGYVKECRRSRIDLEEHIQATIKKWIAANIKVDDF